MPAGNYTHPLFGYVEFVTENKNKWAYGDSIAFTKGFSMTVIKPVLIPQLESIDGAHHGRLEFHERGHRQLQMVFEDIERMGLMHIVKTCAGSLNVRLRKPIPKKISHLPSNHAFEIAIDLNSDDHSNGASIAPVAPIFIQHGFKWGKSFNDPMHFEIESVIDGPKPVAVPATVCRSNGMVLDLGCFNYQGMVVVDLAKVKALLAIAEISRKASSVTLVGQGSTISKQVGFQNVGGIDYVQMTAISGVIGIPMAWDNATKVATLD